MYRASAKHFLSVSLLALAAACGGAEGGPDPVTSSPTERSSEGSSEGSGSRATPPGELPVAEESTPETAPLPRVSPWFQRLGGPQDDVGTGLAVDDAGRVTVAWVSTPRQDLEREPVDGERLALNLSRYSPEGQLLWTREYPRNRVDSLRVVASPEGGLFVSGNAFLYSIDFGLGAASAGFLVRFSPEGEPVWQRRVGQKVYASVADGAGGVLVAGESWTDGHTPLIARYDAQGEALWSRRLGVQAEGTELRAVARDAASGQLLLAGRLVGSLRVDGQDFGAPNTQGLLLLAFGQDGRLVWGHEWRGQEGFVSGVVADAAGGAVLVGHARPSGAGAFVLATGPQGAERWNHPLDCGASPAAPAVARDAEGQVLALCGDTLSTYSLKGEQVDQRTLTPGACSEQDCQVTGTALVSTPGRGLAVTGQQRHGDAETGNQEAFVRLLAP